MHYEHKYPKFLKSILEHQLKEFEFLSNRKIIRYHQYYLIKDTTILNTSSTNVPFLKNRYMVE